MVNKLMTMEILKVKMQCVEAGKSKQGSKVMLAIDPQAGPNGQQLAEAAINVIVLDKSLADKFVIDKQYTITITE